MHSVTNNAEVGCGKKTETRATDAAMPINASVIYRGSSIFNDQATALWMHTEAEGFTTQHISGADFDRFNSTKGTRCK